MLLNVNQKKEFELLSIEYDIDDLDNSDINSYQSIKNYFQDRHKTKQLNDYDKYIDNNLRISLD